MEDAEKYIYLVLGMLFVVLLVVFYLLGEGHYLSLVQLVRDFVTDL